MNTSPSELTPNPQVDFEAYETVLQNLNANSPQHQGLLKEEFAAALEDPSIKKTTVEIEGTEVHLPQLTPIEQFEWLNVDAYRNKFPEETAKGEILHYTDLPNIQPGPEVTERLTGLIANKGVLVFDYPTSDADYENRVIAALESAGAENLQVEELARQTYFTGEVMLKREERPRLEKPLGVMETFEKSVAEGTYDAEKRTNGASILRVVNHDEAVFMNQFYDAAYEELNNTEFCKQGLSPDEFLHMMVAEDDVIKVVNSVDGEIVSLLLLDNDLSKLSWVNEDYYKQRFSEKYANGQVMWFPGLAANPHKKGGMNTQVMVNLVCEQLEAGDNGIQVVFDCGMINTGFLDVFLNDMINKTPQVSIDIQPIAQQRYCAIRTA